MTNTIDSLFDTGLERYKAGESVQSLIPVFKEVCDRSPKPVLPGFVSLGYIFLITKVNWLSTLPIKP